MATKQQKEIFSQVLKEARLDVGLTQKDVASKLGVDRSSIAQWESGITAPKQEIASMLEKVLNVQENAFLKLLGHVTSQTDAEIMSVIEAAEADSRLTEADRELIKTLYRQLVRQNLRNKNS